MSDVSDTAAGPPSPIADDPSALPSPTSSPSSSRQLFLPVHSMPAPVYQLLYSQLSSVAQSCPTLCNPIDCSTPGLPVHHQLLGFTQTHVHRWCHPAISSSIIPFSSRLQSFPESRSFPMSQFFKSGSQRIGVSASPSVLPMNIQDWFPLGWTGWISLKSKGLSRLFSNATVQKHQFFGAQLSL